MSDTLFKSKIAVFRWLDENGWMIGKTQFYDHCRDGLLRPAKGGKNKGRYALSAVRKYAELNCRRADTGLKETDKENRMREEKLEVKLGKERTQWEREQFELEKARGKFVAKSEFELAIVARAVAFMAHLNHTVQQNVQDWIELVEGDQSRAPELVDAISRAIEQRMGDFAADAEFDVIMEANQ